MRKITIDSRLFKSLLTTLGQIVTKGVNSLNIIITVPWLISGLGNEAYGVFVSFYSFLILSSSDLGLGFTLQNKVPYLINDPSKRLRLRAYFSTTFYFLFLVGGLFVLLFYVAQNFIQWQSVFNTTVEENPLRMAASIFFVSTFFMLPFSTVEKVRNGFQLGYLNEIWLTCSSLLSLAILFYLYQQERLSLPRVLLATFGLNLLFAIVGFLVFFLRRQYREFLPRVSLFRLDILKELTSTGILFFVMSILAQLLGSIDVFIVSNKFGADYAAEFSVAYRIISLLSLPVLLLVRPLLPALNDAHTLKEKGWIREVISRSSSYLILYGIGGMLCIYFLSNWIISIWIQDFEMVLSQFELMSLAFYFLVLVYSHFFSVIMLMPHLIRTAFKYYVVAAIVGIMTKFVFINYLGVYGVLWGSVVALPLLYFLPSIRVLRGQMNDME